MKNVLLSMVILTFFTTQIHAQFTSNPLENTQLSDLSGEQAIPKIAVCPDGSMYISWFSNEAGNYNVRMQYLDHNGTAQWEPNGLLISDQEQMSWLTDYSLTADPAGYGIVTFQDIRASGNNNPVGYRVSPAGEMPWGDDGILLANNTNFDVNPQVAATGDGNIVIAWQSQGDVNEVRMQKISPSGDLLWGDGIVLTESGVGYTSPFLQSAPGDHVYLIWHKETGPFWSPNRGLYVQKIDTDGSFMWDNDVEIYAPVPAGPVVYLKMDRDNEDGIVFSWYGNDVGTHFNCWVQHMAADGSLSMPANGVVVSTYANQNHMYPAPAFLPQTDEIIVYFSEQDLNQIQRGLYAQKFDLAGNRLWTDNAKSLIPLTNNDYALPQAGGYMDKAICIYGAFEFGNVVDAKVQAVMLDSDGNYVWDDEFIDMSTVQSQKYHRTMSGYNNGQWVSVWGDERNGNRDIYAQNINLDGSLGIMAGGEGKLLGFVRDAVTNVAIDNATIYATNTDDGYQTSETPFGSHYSFMVPSGNYELSCEAAGYETANVSGVIVMENSNTPHNFYLNPVDLTTSISDPRHETATVFPNPFSNQLNISVSEDINKAVIMDVKGQVVRNIPTTAIYGSTIKLDTRDMNPGFYFYHIETVQGNYSGKLIRY